VLSMLLLLTINRRRKRKKGSDLIELVVLGSSGWIPLDGRMTTALALRLDEDLLLFDAGSGLGRLGSEPFRRLIPEGDRPIRLFLTHLHLDHLVGLTFLPALWSNPTVVHVPAQDATGVGPHTLDSILGSPFFPLAFHELLPGLSREAVREGEWPVNGWRLVAKRQKHPGGSLAYRLDDLFAFLTDCTYDPGAGEFAAGVRLLVHEAWTHEGDDPGADRARTSGHSSAEQAARVARDAGVGELLLSHLPPADDAYYAEMLDRARAIFPNTNLCSDGRICRLDQPG
jgi:ribonuclease Z